MAVAILDGAAPGQYNGCKKGEGKQKGSKRVFIQTDSGNVLSIELDRADNAHTVKKKMQLALHLPTDEASLTFGDLVLKNDLSVVRNDAPLRLTRSSLHRSSSTPCLSPVVDSHLQWDKSGIVEIVGGSRSCPKIKKLVKAAVEGLERCVEPVAVRGGLGGAYYFRNCRGENIAIVKPTDEEPFAPNNPKGFVGKALGLPGLKRSVRVGETGIREVAAYILDYDNFAKVPPTVLVKITHSIFNVNEMCLVNNKDQTFSKLASFQQFVPHDFDASDHGTSSFPVQAVHRIGILDIRILNTDRHSGNLLVRKSEAAGRYSHVGENTVELIPIDHGLCLPENLEDPYFEWLHWPQASLPFSEDELEYISRLDPWKDVDLLRRELPMIREACLRVLMICTIFLKMGAEAGLCLAEIGGMMSREFHGVQEEPSELELICIQAKMEVDQQLLITSEDIISDFPMEQDYVAEQFQFEMDCEDDGGNSGYWHSPRRTCSREFPTLCNGKEGRLESLRIPANSFQPSAPSMSFSHPLRTELPEPSMCKNFGGCAVFSCAGNCHSPRTPRGCRNLLSKLEENTYLEENEATDADLGCMDDDVLNGDADGEICAISGLSNSLRGLSLKDTSQGLPLHAGTLKIRNSQGMCTGKTARTGHDPSLVTVNFVKFSDISDGEWDIFIRCFRELLPEAFSSRKIRNLCQRQRLGTSCQF